MGYQDEMPFSEPTHDLAATDTLPTAFDLHAHAPLVVGAEMTARDLLALMDDLGESSALVALDGDAVALLRRL